MQTCFNCLHAEPSGKGIVNRLRCACVCLPAHHSSTPLRATSAIRPSSGSPLQVLRIPLRFGPDVARTPRPGHRFRGRLRACRERRTRRGDGSRLGQGFGHGATSFTRRHRLRHQGWPRRHPVPAQPTGWQWWLSSPKTSSTTASVSTSSGLPCAAILPCRIATRWSA